MEDTDIRIQTYLARRGIGSRRHCDTMIARGRVKVNGKTIREMGVQVDPDQDVVEVDGHEVPAEEVVLAIAVHKPLGIVSTCRTSRERGAAITDLVDLPYRLYPAGRLDRNSTGLVILTNDGDLALRVTHPRFGKEKEYLVRLDKSLSDSDVDGLRKGIELDDGLVRPFVIQPLSDGTVQVVIAEGRKRIIRRMFKAVGYRVRSLHRIRIGNILLGNLASGDWRYLTDAEIHTLRTNINP